MKEEEEDNDDDDDDDVDEVKNHVGSICFSTCSAACSFFAACFPSNPSGMITVIFNI